MSSTGRTTPSRPTGSSSSSNSASSSKLTSVKKSTRPSSAPSSARPAHKYMNSSPLSSATASSPSSSSRPRSASSTHHVGRLSQSSTDRSPSSNAKSVITERTKYRPNGAGAQTDRRQLPFHVHPTGHRTQKGCDVTAVRELLSSDEQVTDKSASDVSPCSRDADSQEVRSNSVIRQTADDGRNNEPTSAAAAACSECAPAANTVLTSGASQAARSSSCEGQFTADAAPRGASTVGPTISAVHDASSSASSETSSNAAGRRTIDNDDYNDDDDALKQRHGTDTGLMCRNDVVARRNVTNDVGDRCSDVASMADKRRKSPDPFYDDDYDFSVGDTVEVPYDCSVQDEMVSVQRQNSVLVQLLSAKKQELEEARQRFRVCTAGLEDEVDRLRHEKERLLDRLQLPEDERCSLSAEQQSLNELVRRLRQCEEQNDELKNENMELKQDLRDAELAMHELHDQFQAEEGVELRELQRELDNTSRDCRLLHFKVCLPTVIYIAHAQTVICWLKPKFHYIYLVGNLL